MEQVSYYYYSVSFCTSMNNHIESLVSHSSLAKMSYLSEISCSLNRTSVNSNYCFLILFPGDDDSKLIGWLQVRDRQLKKKSFLQIVNPAPEGPFRKAPWHGNIQILKFWRPLVARVYPLMTSYEFGQNWLSIPVTYNFKQGHKSLTPFPSQMYSAIFECSLN